MEIPEDHIHTVVRSEPKISPSQIMQVVKNISAREFFKMFPDIKKRYFWGGKLRIQSYYVETIGAATEESIRNYVQNQLVKLDKKEVYTKNWASMLKISVITVTLNAEKTLQHCFSSIQSQTFPVEHIVVDGNSTDATQEIIKTNSNHISQFVSEPDKGLDDARNKALLLATGDIVGILNADDYYADPEVLARVTAVFEDPLVDSCYGDLLYVAEDRGSSKCRVVRYWQSGQYDSKRFFWGWVPPHPTFFTRRSIYAKYGLFNLNLGIATDYELMLRFLLKHNISCRYIPEVLVCMRTGGVSNASLRSRFRALRMCRKAWKVNELKPYPWTIPLKSIRKIPQWWLRPKM